MAGSDVQDQDITALASESLLLELTDQHLEWKFLGRHLGLTEGNLVEIEQKHKGDIKEMKYQTLLKWKQKFGKRATIGHLAKALKKVGRTDLADDVMQDQRNRVAVLPPQLPNDQRNRAVVLPPQPPNGNGIDGLDQVDNNCTDNGDPAHRPLSGAKGNGATAPANPQGANVYGDTPRCPLLEGNGATAPANPQGANEIQMTSMVASQSGDESATYVNMPRPSKIGSSVVLPTDESDQGPSSIQVAEGGDPTPGSQFSVAAIGNELITDEEINDVADEAHNHYGTYFTSLDRFCSKFGMKRKDYKRVLEEEKSSSAQDRLFYALLNWHAQQPQTKEAFRKSLCKVDKQLGIWYVGYVNGQVNDQQ